MSGSPRQNREREAGYSLVEVLVALAVTGLVLAALLPALHLARSRAVLAEERQLAVLFARSQMELLKLKPRTTAGRIDGYDPPWAWSAEVRMEPPPPRATVQLRSIRLSVGHETLDHPLLTVETKQIVPVTAP